MSLRSSLADYVTLRRELGFSLRRDEKLLIQFTTYLEARDAEFVTLELALTWATLPEACSALWGAQRLRVVRGFARYLQGFDARHCVPSADLLRDGRHRATPYLYSSDEITSLMRAALAIATPLRAASTAAIIGLLASSGLRVGEALALERDDVDFDRGVLTVRHAKFNKTRLIVLHATSVTALRAYASEVEQLMPRAKSSAFFLSATGTRVLYCNFHAAFHQLVARTLETSSSQHPRVHDLRHTFATRVLERWYAEGDDVAAQLPALSTYLGHVNPSATYWYLSGSPELLEQATKRLEATYEDLS